MRTAKAVALGPSEATALPTGGLQAVRVGGKQCLAHGGPFQVSPSGSLKSLSLIQPVAYAKTDPGQGGGNEEEPDDAGGGGGAGARSDFSDPSAMHKMVSRCSSARLADLVPPEHAHLVGDPVDVATGAVVTEFADIKRSVPAIEFRRSYNSKRSGRDGPLGFGWTHTFDQALWLEAGRVVVRQDGREIEFDCRSLPDGVARAGDVLYDLTELMQLRCHGRNHWEWIGKDETRHFTPVEGTSSEDRDRGFARLTKIIRPDQPLIDLEYDRHARLYSVRVDGRSIFTLRYDTNERIESLGDGTTRFTYSENGDLVEATDAAGAARTYEYAGHLLVRETNRRGGAFYYGYDGHGPGAKCVRTWGTRGRLHRVLSYESDATVVTDSLGHRTTYSTNAVGLVVSVADPLGNVTLYGYDDALRLTKITYPDGTAVADSFDEEGRWVKRRERDGALWRMHRDAQGRITEGFDPQGGRWRFAYDFEGRLTRVMDPLGHVTRLEYLHRQLERIIDPLGRVTEVQLGPDDEVLRVAPPGGEGVTFAYDGRGNLVEARPDRSVETRWSYDALGRVASVACGGDFVHFGRDEEGSLTRVERPKKVWSYGRDVLGTLDAIEDGDTRVEYDYDTEGRMVRAKKDGKARLEVRRDERGLVSAYVVGGMRDTVVLRKPKTEYISSLSNTDGLLEIKWDAGGRIVQFEDADGTRRFAYRDDGLLTQFSSPHRACTVDRNLRGVVLEQLQGEVVVKTPHLDHLGNRYGLDVGDDASISYLWTVDGELDRIAVAGDSAFDVTLDREPGVAPDVSDPECGHKTDALHRPTQSERGPCVWDEGQLVKDGAALFVVDPRSGHVVASIEGEEISKDPELPFSVGRTLRAEEQAYADSFPTRVATPKLEDRVPTPLGLLRQTFHCRVWDPVVRPLAGALPWHPDKWHPDDGDTAPVATRLDSAALMHLLSPFPRPLLR